MLWLHHKRKETRNRLSVYPWPRWARWHQLRQHQWREKGREGADTRNNQLRALTSAKIPARLEPSGLYCSYGIYAPGWHYCGPLEMWKAVGVTVMRHVQTLMPHHTLRMQPVRQGLWLLMLRRGRKLNISPQSCAFLLSGGH